MKNITSVCLVLNYEVEKLFPPNRKLKNFKNWFLKVNGYIKRSKLEGKTRVN